MEKISDGIAWDSALRTLPEPHVLQAWAWGALKERHGWEARRLLWQEDGEAATAAAQLLTQQRSSFALGYVPKGPILDWTDLGRVEAALRALETLAREQSLLFLKIDPDVRTDTTSGKRVVDLLKARGWRPSFEQIQFRNTMFLDLRPDLDTILSEMKSKWRYNVRLAARRGVVVRQVVREELPMLYEMYAETAARDEFIIREEDYYLDAWRTFMEAGMAVPLVAEVEETPVAMLVLFYFGERAWYMYGASLDLHRNLMPNHRLQWEAIRRARDLGCTTYDMWGAPDVLDDSDPLWGVYRFKVGFGAEFIPHIGAYDFAPRPFLYRIYAWLRPHLVALAHRRYRAKRNT
ncbi:MAG: lipid II:glycine glycyltransferase FemX [Anaerolineae bacterium]